MLMNGKSRVTCNRVALKHDKSKYLMSKNPLIFDYVYLSGKFKYVINLNLLMIK
jgi:hypothetical protein